MAVAVEKKHIDIYNKIADDINKLAKKFKQENYKTKLDKYERLLLRKDVSVEKKKKEIVKHLHALIIKTFSINPDKIKSHKSVLNVLKNNLRVIRRLVIKLRDINYYLENTLLGEIKLTKKIIRWDKLDDKAIKKLIEEEGVIKKKELEKLEHITYKLIERTISLDQRLLKRYKRKEERILKKATIKINDLKKMLAKESDLLAHLEAKLPPHKIKKSLLKKAKFSEWVSKIFALLSAFENEYEKESLIFEKLKRNEKLRKKIDIKIAHLIKEKFELLKLREKRLLSMEKAGKVEAYDQKIFHSYASALRL